MAKYVVRLIQHCIYEVVVECDNPDDVDSLWMEAWDNDECTMVDGEVTLDDVFETVDDTEQA